MPHVIQPGGGGGKMCVQNRTQEAWPCCRLEVYAGGGYVVGGTVCYYPPHPHRKTNPKSPSKNEGTTPSPGRFSPNPVVLRLIVMFSVIVTGRIDRFKPPSQKMKAIPPPPPLNEYCRFSLLNAEPLCLAPSIRAYTPVHTGLFSCF